MKSHELGYELPRDEMRLLLANSILGDVRAVGILKASDPASKAGRRAAVRTRLFSRLGDAHLVAIHEASPELDEVRAERARILTSRESMTAAELRSPEEVSVILGRRTIAWALEGIRPYVESQSKHVRDPEAMKAFIEDFDAQESSRIRQQIVEGTPLEIAS